MKKNNKLVALMVLASVSFITLPANSYADDSYSDVLADTNTDVVKVEEYSEEKENTGSSDLDTMSKYEFDDDEVNFPKNESQDRNQDGTDKFNRGTETDRETFGQDNNVNNMEPEIQEKLEKTNGEYGLKDGKYGGNNLKENLDPIKNIVVNQGTNENQVAITWFGKGEYQKSKVVFNGKTYEAKGSKTGDNAGYYSYRVIIDGIIPGNSYHYYVQTGNEKSKVYTLQTKGFGDDNSFSVGWFGDPQLGSGDSVWDSKGLEKNSQGKVDQDKADFAKAIKKAKEENPNFYLSVGDNVEIVSFEGEYDAFLDNDIFREGIFASVTGNHETYMDKDDPVQQNTVFKDHFYLPNESKLGSIVDISKQNKPIHIPGDFYFTYGDTLFLNLNSNVQDSKIHEEFIKKAIQEAKDKRGSNFSWTVVSFHHAPYSTATHTADDDIIQRRKEMVKIFNNNGIDLVLNGHDHIYSRSYPMLAGENAMTFEEAFGTDMDNPSAQVENGYSNTYNTKIYGKDMVVVDGIPVKHDNNTLTNPRGTIFLTMSDSSGSKFYNLISEDSWYVARSLDDRSQLFSKLVFSKHKFQLITKDINGDIKDWLTINKSDEAIKEGMNLMFAKDKTALKNTVENAKSLAKNIAFEQLPAYLQYIEKANSVLEDETATQEAVNQAKNVLMTKLLDLNIKESNAQEEIKNTEIKKDDKTKNTKSKNTRSSIKNVKQEKHTSKKSTNPKTGLTGLNGILFLLSSAIGGLIFTKRK